jgi:hypothetical protein
LEVIQGDEQCRDGHYRAKQDLREDRPTCPPYNPSAGQSQKLQQKSMIWRNGRVYELPTIGDDPDGNAFAIDEE